MIKVGWKQKVKTVKRGKTSKGGDWLRFNISDKIKGENPDNDKDIWQRYGFLMWSDLPNLEDDMTVVIKKIDSIEVEHKDYKDKHYKEYTIIGECEIVEQTEEMTPISDDSLPF